MKIQRNIDSLFDLMKHKFIENCGESKEKKTIIVTRDA
jgi:hypothetical protein